MESGFLIVNKPIGPTSHDIVNKIRRITGIKKVGHAGTLDPFAEGVLFLAVGRAATKRIAEVVKKDKEYIADICLGSVTDTFDRTGKTIEKKETTRMPSKKQIEEVLKRFVGEQEQVPPMYSAKKIKGRKLYQLARLGQEIPRDPNWINVFSIELLGFDFPVLKIRVKCSPGTYLRVLAFDIGRFVGTGAHLQDLKRTAVGSYTIDQALDLDSIKKDNWKEFLFDI